MHIFLAIGNFEWGAFHSYLYHFPIILFTLSLICDLFYGFGKKGALAIGHWLIISGTLFVIPTVLTGFAAIDGIHADNSLLENHKLLGIITLIYAIPYAIYRFYLYKNKRDVHPIIVVGLSVILVGFLMKTNEYGALLSQG